MNEIAIIEVPEENALALFTKEKGLDPLLKSVIDQVRSFAPDLSTKKGRDEIASTAYKVSKSKTAIDAVGKDLVSKLKEQPKLVDAERKRVRDLLDDLRDEVRKPLTDWENAEQKRVDDIKQRINDFQVDDITRFENSDQLAAKIENIKAVDIDDSFAEFKSEAIIARDNSISFLSAHHEKLCKAEAERKELEELREKQREQERIDRENQIAKEAEERAKQEAERKAEDDRLAAERAVQAEREEAERRELELRLAAEKAQREKLEAQKAAEQAEIDARAKLEAAAEAERQEAIKREANTKHRASINNAALDSLVDLGITKEKAKKVITAIAKGKIPNVSIAY